MKNKKNNVKLLLIIISLVMLVITLYVITNTYALFFSEAKGTMQANLAKWEIEINKTDISNNKTKEFIIDTINISKNNFTEDNHIAPGGTGYFDIVINLKDTDVSVRYDLSINTESLKENSKIKINSIELLEKTNTFIQTGDYCYTSVIPLENIKNGNNVNTIRITFEWENDETNNEADTNIGTKPNYAIKLPVILNVSQYLGEEITTN